MNFFRTKTPPVALLGIHHSDPRPIGTEQSYVEDCPVCCKPMLVSYTAADGKWENSASSPPSDAVSG